MSDQIKLNNSETRIMNVLWEKGQLPAKEVALEAAARRFAIFQGGANRQTRASPQNGRKYSRPRFAVAAKMKRVQATISL